MAVVRHERTAWRRGLQHWGSRFHGAFYAHLVERISAGFLADRRGACDKIRDARADSRPIRIEVLHDPHIRMNGVSTEDDVLFIRSDRRHQCDSSIGQVPE